MLGIDWRIITIDQRARMTTETPTGPCKVSAGHTIRLASKDAGMMSVSLVWWPLVRINSNLRSVSGGLASRPAENAACHNDVLPTFVHNRTVMYKIAS